MMDRAVIFRSDPGLVTNILSSHIHGGVSRHLPDPDVDLVSEDAKTLPCHASVLAAASPLLARMLRRPVIEEEEARVRIIFGGVNHTELSSLLSYIYTGSCTIDIDTVKEFSSFLSDLGVRTSSVKSPEYKFKVKEEASADTAPDDELDYIISQCDVFHDDQDSDEEDDVVTNTDVKPFVGAYQANPCAVNLENIGFHNYSPPASPSPKKRSQKRKVWKSDSDSDYFEEDHLHDYKPTKKKTKKLKKKSSQIIKKKRKNMKTGKFGEDRTSKGRFKMREGRENLSEEEIQKLLSEREANEVYLLEPLLVFSKDKIGLSKCYWCVFEADNLVDLQLHTKTGHPDRLNTFNRAFGYKIFGELNCQFCGFNWKTLPELKQHVQMTHPEKREEFSALANHDCLICKHKSFNNSERMNHELRVHGIKHKTHCCQLCGEVPKNRYNREHKKDQANVLLSHMTVHKTGKAKPYICDVCGLSFRLEVRHKEHLLKHRLGDFLCTDCGATFKSDHDMERHKAFGTCISDVSLAPRKKFNFNCPRKNVKLEPDGSYICDNCGEFFTVSSRYQRHIAVCGMKEEDMFACEHCGKKFRRIPSLKKHLETHGEPTIPCTQCDKKFKSERHRDRHMTSQHLKDSEKPFQCIDCGKGFMSEAQLKDHTNVHTGLKPYQCRHCLTMFQNKSNRMAHEKKVHGVKTEDNRSKGFSAQSLYANIAENMVSAEKPYQCRFCPLAYANSSNRNAHEKKRHAEGDAVPAVSAPSSQAPEKQKVVTDEDAAAIDYIIRARWANGH